MIGCLEKEIMMLFRSIAIVAFLLAGCQGETAASATGDEAERSLIKRKAEPLAVPPDDPCLDAPGADSAKCAEAAGGAERFAGKWKITRVHVNPEGVQAFVEDDKAIIGSIFSITPGEIKWVVKASAAFTADDVCKQPAAGPLPESVEKAQGGALTAALARFGVSASARGTIHRFACTGGGTWGPGNGGADESGGLFIPVGTTQMLLKWYDGATLLAVRSDP